MLNFTDTASLMRDDHLCYLRVFRVSFFVLGFMWVLVTHVLFADV